MSKTSGVTTNQILAQLEQQDFHCALTGIPLTPGNAQLDHIIPSRQGGEHTAKNVQILHEDVNRMKGAMIEADFIELCRQVVEHTNELKKQRK